MNVAPTLPTSCGSLPPEGALRLRPGKAGSAAPAWEEPPRTYRSPFVLSLSKDASLGGLLRLQYLSENGYEYS